MTATTSTPAQRSQLTPLPRFIGAQQTRSPCPRVGPIDTLPSQEVLEKVVRLRTWSDLSGAEARTRLRAAERMLNWLADRPGNGWQERWDSCESDPGPLSWVAGVAAAEERSLRNFRSEIVSGLAGLLLCRLVLPSYDFLVGYNSVRLFADVRTEHSIDAFTRAEEAARTRGMAGRQVSQALTVLSKIVLHTGKDLHEVTSDDVFEFRAWNINRYGQHKSGIHGAWDVLRDIGVLDTSQSLRATLRLGQVTTEELVAQRQIQCPGVRDLLIRYLNERRPGMDFSSFRQLTSTLASTFWADIERHHPGIGTLDLPPEVADAWKARLAFTSGTKGPKRPRRGRLEVLGRVRAFYLDIQEWAHEDPSWAPWAVRCPIRRSELEGVSKRNRARTAEVHQRIRERLPHLPALVDTAEKHREDQATLLATARQTPISETFAHAGRAYRRVQYRWDTRSASQHGPDAVLVTDESSDERIELLRKEEDAFWAWAIIETLRHTGVRIEELLELTHLALISYRLPDSGEIVPLLQIVPSKSNEERLLLVTPELASVLAAVVCRIRGADGRVPLAARYDPHERVTGPMLPHLFQRKIGWRREIIGTKILYRLLNETLQRSGLTDRSGQPLRYTPHDFRRMFITDAVTGGLPVHIAAKILGHHSLNTTQAYLAVFQEELIRSYRSFLDTRRAARPAAEYREPTEQEWDEFQKHFELRKVELGTCGRPYGTPCAHEHACVRCPMLRVDPQQRRRLEEIIRSLGDRIEEARVNGWLGEVQGLQVSLEAARNKLASLDRLVRTRNRAPVTLGMPIIPGGPR
ncbi:tyrosine-type recombinase/integrase [Streptomyces hesseae]|uniref:Site-specific integrase n=1 Tax=Streptomyces hesseae TaxID=3075519 RepID=A0ABU2SXR4_9ACTN|nr:site-specific integrase [Streptomyces sp. DSM 40473]MDT0453791.1 site-specific integrase [Streptomyces sp. DSM 40473]